MAHASLENTPTWAVSVVVLLLCLVSILIEAFLHLLTKFLKRRKRKSLIRALEKIKSDLMEMGFISLLLTIGEEPLAKICVSKNVGESFLSCTVDGSGLQPLVASATQISGSNATAVDGVVDKSSCEAKGMVPFISRDGIKQLHIFIIVLAVFHVLYCVLTMCLGLAKMRRWKRWEEETRTLHYQIANDPRRFIVAHQTSFGQRHVKSWSSRRYLLWPVCFLRQFTTSVTKADYFVLRNGFIAAHLCEGSNFDFHKFLNRAFDDDFEMVVGISFWIWIFSIFFIFFSAHGFYSYFWLPFIPLVMVLTLGAKLQVIITKMCLKGRNKGPVVKGVPLVEPNDNLFWFNRPQLLLPLLHFILFQNSFQLAFFCWAWYEFGLRSCFHRKTEDIVLGITMGVFVQLLCGYVTLPLYALVTQMGSEMKKAVFTERVTKGLKNWHSLAQRNLPMTQSSRKDQGHSSQPSISNTVETFVQDVPEMGFHGCENPAKLKDAPPMAEIIEEVAKPKSRPSGLHDGEVSFGEISFGTSWKVFEGENKSGEIKSALEDANSDGSDSIQPSDQ